MGANGVVTHAQGERDPVRGPQLHSVHAEVADGESLVGRGAQRGEVEFPFAGVQGSAETVVPEEEVLIADGAQEVELTAVLKRQWQREHGAEIEGFREGLELEEVVKRQEVFASSDADLQTCCEDVRPG